MSVALCVGSQIDFEIYEKMLRLKDVYLADTCNVRKDGPTSLRCVIYSWTAAAAWI